MDRTRRFPSSLFCGLVWRSPMGFYSKSFRFEGGGRHIIGLNRTGKSCRLRWVNYLHPGLKRGKMTPHEERLVLELHSKWGNRWSKIARKLPGRTDNEIKNYWRTHMRKISQERKRAVSLSPSSSSSSLSSTKSCSSSSTNPKVDSLPSPETGKGSFYDTGGLKQLALTGKNKEKDESGEEGYSMDEIWKDIDSNLSEESAITPIYNKYTGPPLASSPMEYSLDSLWKMDEEENKMFPPISDQFLSCCSNDPGMACL